MPAVATLPYDVATAKVFGQIRAKLEASGTNLPDADLQIAATAIYHDLELVSGTYAISPAYPISKCLGNSTT